MNTLAAASLPAYSYAFQPIVDVPGRKVYSVEALVRGAAGEPAARFHRRGADA